jgi:hypothetical protein
MIILHILENITCDRLALAVAKLIAKLCFESSILGGGTAESYDRCFGGSDVVLPLLT